MFVVMFLLIGAFFIVSNNNIHLGISEERAKLSGIYYNWVNSLFDKVKEITSYVVKSEWLPDANIKVETGKK